jgi:hypothetical protein
VVYVTACASEKGHFVSKFFLKLFGTRLAEKYNFWNFLALLDPYQNHEKRRRHKTTKLLACINIFRLYQKLLIPFSVIELFNSNYL